jgi:integrase
MAWIYRYKGKTRWFIGWRSAGKVKARSTGTADKREAEKQLAAFVALQAIHERGGPLDELYRSLTSATSKPVALRTLKAELDDWLVEATATTAASTSDRYKGISDSLVQYFGATDEKPALSSITSDALRDYLTDTLKRKSPSTANMERKVLRVFFRRAVVNGRLTHDPAAAVKPFRGMAGKDRRRPFTVEEVKLLLSKAEGFWRFAVLCGFYTGLRLSDISGMPVGAVDLKERVIRLAAIKTGTRVVLPIPAVLAKEIQERIAQMKKPSPTDLLWPDHAAMRSGARSNQFHALLVKCGLVSPRTHAKAKQGRDVGRQATDVSFHCMRHTFVSLLKATGSGQAVAKSLAGHSSDLMSDHYTSLPIETLRGAVANLPDVS